jgi:hypothetical protein
MNEHDTRLVELFLEPVRKCATYKPAFGQGDSDGLSITDFQSLYGQDQFYAWIGLDDPLLYAAHKAAGGLTSVYRQVGVGSERLLRAIMMESLHLSDSQVEWRYNYAKPDKKQGVHILDAKIVLADLTSAPRQRFEAWLKSALKQVARARPAEGNPQGQLSRYVKDTRAQIRNGRMLTFGLVSVPIKHLYCRSSRYCLPKSVIR